MKNKPTTLKRDFSWSFASKWHKVKVNSIAIDDDEVYQWCNENCAGRWAIGWSGDMWFANLHDRTAFVLRFL